MARGSRRHVNADICIFPAGPEACEADTHGCQPCKLRGWRLGGGMQLAPSATPTKTKRMPPAGTIKGNNSWERPVVTDERGMPLIDGKDFHLIRQKEYSERRSEIESTRRKIANEPRKD